MKRSKDFFLFLFKNVISESRFESALFPEEEESEQNNEPKGRRWLDAHLDEEAITLMQDERYTQLMEFVPWKSGVCYDFARILATRDVTLVKSVLGLEFVQSVPADLVATHCEDTLGRGSRETQGHANTNRSYFSRQLGFLEFLSTSEDHQSSIEKIAKELGKSAAEARRILPRINGPVLLASDAALKAYLIHIRSERDVHVSKHLSIMLFRRCTTRFMF